MVSADRTLVCRECGGEFIFSAGEQAFYSERGFVEPSRSASADENPRQHFEGCRIRMRHGRRMVGKHQVLAFADPPELDAYHRTRTR